MIYKSDPIGDGDVWIGAPVGVPTYCDSEVLQWYDEARGRDDVVYFGIWEGEGQVGQIFLHDIDRSKSSALIGYHIFEVRDRGRGIGRQALAHLVDYAWRNANLRELIIITGKDNKASCRLAVRCGFELVGAAREQPNRDLVYRLLLEG